MEYQNKKVNDWLYKQKDDPIGYIVITHLFVEHGLDFLVHKHCKNPNRILKDHRKYTFAVKLDLCKKMHLIPKPLYNNIKMLNSLRNKMVHNLDVDYKALNDYFIASNGEKMFPIGNLMYNKNDSEGLTTMIGKIRNLTLYYLHTLIIEEFIIGMHKNN